MTHCVITYYIDDLGNLCAHDDEDWTMYQCGIGWIYCSDELLLRLEIPKVYALLFLDVE